MFALGDEVIWQNPKTDLDLTVEELIDIHGMQNAGTVVGVGDIKYKVRFPLLGGGKGIIMDYSPEMLRLITKKEPDWTI